MTWSTNTFGYDATPVAQDVFKSSPSVLENNPFAKGGGKGMAFPFMAAATLGSSVLGGIFSGNQEAKNRQLAADLGKMQAEAAMQGAFRNAQLGQWNTTSAPEYQYELQKRARNFENKFFKPEEMFLASEERKRVARDELSPEARELSARNRADYISRITADRRAITDAMFGAPAFASSRYTNPAWMQTA
jgi:hypothetical protein